MPRRLSSLASAFWVSTSSLGPTLSSISTMVTSAPKAFQTVANSTPMAPAPSTMGASGTRSM